MAISHLYPTQRPSLDLNFARQKRLDSRVTFTRGSTATYVGSDGLIKTAASGEARFDHNPETGESLGLLVEEARTNQARYSEQFDNGAWSKSDATVTANAGIAPDGTTTADEIVENLVSNPHRVVIGSLPSVAGSDLTVSVFVKRGVGTRNCFIYLRRYTGTAWGGCVLNFDTESLTVQSGKNHKLTKLPNGWFKVSFTGTADTTGSVEGNLQISLVTNDISTQVYPGDGTSSIYAWGAQVETGSLATSYIPTTSSTVTRAVDVCTVTNSNIYDTDSFTILNEPFGSAAGGSTLSLVGAGETPIKRTAVYSQDLTQTQINASVGKTDEFWRWRVLGSSFALPEFLTDGQVTVDWGDGTIETLTTAEHTFSNGGGYHDIGFRLDSGTYFRPHINNNASHDTKVVALGPAPESMKLNGDRAFFGCNNLEAFDATIDATGGTSFLYAWYNCTSLTSFPLINTAAGTNFQEAWRVCNSLTSFPAIDTSSGTNFALTWWGCSSLTSFPLINTAAGTNFQQTWVNCNSLTSFPLINTAAGTYFTYAWQNCSSLTSFPLLNTAAGTNFGYAWNGCSSLTSFPLIDTSSGTNFQQAWDGCSSLTSFPLIDTAAGTNFVIAWRNCSNLTSFPLINTAAGTNFSNAWQSCSSLTSFPLINTAAGTNFNYAWYGCSSLTSFPLIDTSSGTSFNQTWYNCSSLTSFPLINTAAGTDFYRAWFICSSLTDFPANFFDSWTGTPVNNCFVGTWDGCSALTATSVENILNSIDTSGQSAPASGVDITIDYNAGTGTPSVATAVTNLKSRGWTITLNGVAQ